MNSPSLNVGITWNELDDTSMILLDDTEPNLRMIATMYLNHKDYYSKEWRIGYRNALFLTLSRDSYNRFIELIANN